MNPNAALTQARKQADKAIKAGPVTLKHNGKLYTAVFISSRWVYEVYEDGFLMATFNCKSPADLKKTLLHYLAN